VACSRRSHTVCCMGLFHAVGYIAALLGAATAFTQIAHSLRTRSVAGVSFAWWVASWVDTVLWLSYGVVTKSGQQIVGNVPWALMGVVTAVLFVRSGRYPWHVPVVIALTSGVLAAGLVSWWPMAVGVVGLVFALAQAPAQLRAALMSDDLSGVSVPSWVLRCVTGLCWLTFGVGTGDTPVVVTSAARLLLNVAVVVVLVQVLRRSQD
jgi:uncharacterized protein with PQ loop repeat